MFLHTVKTTTGKMERKRRDNAGRGGRMEETDKEDVRMESGVRAGKGQKT